jgi:twitching motility two-component system response regulator PilG
MNSVSSSDPTQVGARRFALELLGFPEAEKAMLSSTFRLSRRPMFCSGEPYTLKDRPDNYLVNADNPVALQLLQTRAPSIYAPAVLIGRSNHASNWPLVEKPVHWTRLFDQLDTQMSTALQERARRNAAATAPEWDGRTYRRAIDKKQPEPIMLESSPIESVLVVDDSATVRAFMRAKLALFRFDVDYAENGEKAIDMAQAKNYTCIFLDIMMPGMDGYQVCKRLKSSSAAKGTTVVMLSSKSSAFDKFRGSWAGCDAYLSKPVGEEELLATIARFLPSSRRIAAAIVAPAS